MQISQVLLLNKLACRVLASCWQCYLSLRATEVYEDLKMQIVGTAGAISALNCDIPKVDYLHANKLQKAPGEHMSAAISLLISWQRNLSFTTLIRGEKLPRSSSRTWKGWRICFIFDCSRIACRHAERVNQPQSRPPAAH